MATRDDYYALEARAQAKGYTTFGDLVDACGVDPVDLWFGEWDESMRYDALYWCDGAHVILESLAEQGLI